jgi:hypothetical protein
MTQNNFIILTEGSYSGDSIIKKRIIVLAKIEVVKCVKRFCKFLFFLKLGGEQLPLL